MFSPLDYSGVNNLPSVKVKLRKKMSSVFLDRYQFALYVSIKILILRMQKD